MLPNREKLKEVGIVTAPAPSAGATFTWKGILNGARMILPVAIFFVPLGMAFGAAASAKSMPVLVVMLMSVTVYAGAAQFAALGLWTAPLPLLMLALTVFAINSRHIVLGAVLSPWLRGLVPTNRLAAVLFLSDANYSLALTLRERGETDAGTLFGSGFVMWLAWVLGTALGVCGGVFVGDPSHLGIDVVMLAFFTAVLVGRWDRRDSVIPVAIAAIAAASMDIVLPDGWPIVAGALAGGTAGVFRDAR